MFHFLFPWLLTCFHAMVFFLPQKSLTWCVKFICFCSKHILRILRTNWAACVKVIMICIPMSGFVSRFDSPLYWVPGVWSPGSEGWVLGGTHHELKHHCNYLNFGMFYLWFKHNYFQDVAWFSAGRCWGEGNLQQHKAVYPLHGVIQHWRGCVHFCCGCSRHARNSYTCMYLHTHTIILLILSFQKFIGNNCGPTSCTHLGCIFLAYVSGVQRQLGSCVP